MAPAHRDRVLVAAREELVDQRLDGGEIGAAADRGKRTGRLGRGWSSGLIGIVGAGGGNKSDEGETEREAAHGRIRSLERFRATLGPVTQMDLDLVLEGGAKYGDAD